MWKKVIAVLIGLMIGYWYIDSFDPEKLKGKRVLITGASTGIGEHIAYHYASFGANIMITARRENALKDVISKCESLGKGNGKYHYVTADMKNMKSTKLVVQEAIKKLGGIDILVLNHILEVPLGEWLGTEKNFTMLDNIMEVNFKAYIHLTSHSLAELEKNKGSIIVVNSLAGKFGIPFVSAYSASKFALDGFFIALRQELKMRKCDISITSCILGLIENALSKLGDFGLKRVLSLVKSAQPSDAALAIVKGGAVRAREIYFPFITIPSFILRDWMPGAIDLMLSYVHTPDHYQ
ncbi:hypothetical protein LOTGIDRAFT_138116 [Lottia gigantea]|uniref:Hydroxysteroid 11-beta-dehydrogenase 1-like protein n=1 Tax=Lottia gigantea TaxID=225164 RepID=V4BA22_LOTGI|nr:hypothetical protein LOTGIDRAFT_138116 [Lottia gigantea]ESP02592.1 hypothetical protein LOTGIDRAFT_138116 [Lottia gigantea]